MSLPFCALLFGRAFFLFTSYSCAYNSSPANAQQYEPPYKAAIIARLWRLRFVRQLRRYGVGLGNFLGRIGIAVILPTILTVPVFNIALGVLGCRLGLSMLDVGVIIPVKLAIGFATDLAYRFFGAGCLAAGVVRIYLTTVVTNVIVICIFVVSNYLFTVIADVIFVRVLVVGNHLFAEVTDVIFVCVLMV